MEEEPAPAPPPGFPKGRDSWVHSFGLISLRHTDSGDDGGLSSEPTAAYTSSGWSLDSEGLGIADRKCPFLFGPS